jgi:predicted dehydrogenase
MSDPLKLIQAGVGGHGKGWLHHTTSTSEQVEVVAVVDPNDDARQAAVEHLGLDPKHAFADLEAAVEAVEAEALLSVTPPAIHRQQAETAFGHGLHLLVEKPLSDTLADAKDMVDLADQAGKQLMVGQNRRWDPEPIALEQLVADRPLGEVDHAHLTFDLFTDFRGSFRQTMPHVLLVDMAVHHIDLIRHVFKQDITRVYAVDFNTKWATREELSEDGIALKMILTLRDDTYVSYTGDWSARGRQSSWQGDWRIQCERGAMEFSRSHGIVLSEGGFFGEGATERSIEIPKTPSSQGQLLAAFVRACRTGEPGLTSGRDNLKTLAAVFAAVESCETGNVVDVTL